jgi:nucleotide-binding universal stress UspA family protein
MPMRPDSDAVWNSPEDKTLSEEKQHDADADLTESVVEAARRVGVYCHAVEMKSSSPTRAIVDAAKNYCCDVIYMTPHTSSGQPGTSFRESLAYQVLEKSAIPVLVFR